MHTLRELLRFAMAMAIASYLHNPGHAQERDDELRATDEDPVPVHWSEVKPAKRVHPVFPEAAKQLGLTDVRCQVRMIIGTDGTPLDVQPVDCPEVFVEEALSAARQWRFYPMKIEGVPQKSTFMLTFRFDLSGGEPVGYMALKGSVTPPLLEELGMEVDSAVRWGGSFGVMVQMDRVHLELGYAGEQWEAEDGDRDLFVRWRRASLSLGGSILGKPPEVDQHRAGLDLLGGLDIGGVHLVEDLRTDRRFALSPTAGAEGWVAICQDDTLFRASVGMQGARWPGWVRQELALGSPVLLRTSVGLSFGICA